MKGGGAPPRADPAAAAAEPTAEGRPSDFDDGDDSTDFDGRVDPRRPGVSLLFLLRLALAVAVVVVVARVFEYKLYI